MDGIRSCLAEGLGVQVNVTLSNKNRQDIESVLGMVGELGISDVHMFFLVPTGRGRTEDTVQPMEYEELIKQVLSRKERVPAIRPTCAPQFLRIADQMGIGTTGWGRGCIAGINYCRVLYDGTVTPCPYMDLSVGNVRASTMGEIWNGSRVLRAMRDMTRLTGKCGRCEYRDVCGGCRAHSYSMAGQEVTDDEALFGEDPWCLYVPIREDMR